uniref:Uncharacterized protein n=1 Tax=Chromera velia CCMP2878 TaxID=1169474 RepID=A0A0G4G1W7_9ALVE|eukprot:Cvel_4077.t1-p1 / transcript=Cvel_4077.t1 / gene=Cvel_4077 / organism=Chromera_velia_CCMP2878 / gene_product=hypothetical protein / transcript_product=hypothetical protein / location=Cvel_scaffold173:113220-113704(-) / protein_length=117 / sequence_SO=supercontig / SO=protein_coding / is_pseudo=false
MYTGAYRHLSLLSDFNFSDIEDDSEEKKNKSVKTSLVLAAQKGDFQQMVMDIQKLDQGGLCGFNLFAKLKQQYNENVAVEKNAERQKHRGLERKQGEELDDAVDRQGRQVLSCQRVG